MSINWDYTDLAQSYLKRPQYSNEAISAAIRVMSIDSESEVCDIGAGVGHLTKHLCKFGFKVTAVEPNTEMYKFGVIETQSSKNLTWKIGRGEQTGEFSEKYQLVTFGSSFNVCNRLEALQESHRILKKNGWIMLLWNHRDLNDPFQYQIENIIKNYIPNYDYGTRRQDQTDIIQKSLLFNNILRISGQVTHKQNLEDFSIAWSSHATLAKQAGHLFSTIINDLNNLALNWLNSNNQERLVVPYETNIWIAKKLEV